MGVTAIPEAATASFTAMGTMVTVVAPADHRLFRLVEAVIRHWDRTLSRFTADSELAALNASAGEPRSVGPVLFAATKVALDAARATDGLFDPLLARRMEELGYDRTFQDLPANLTSAQPLGPWRRGAWRGILVDAVRKTVRLPPGTAMDLGGIAKGMAVDAALEQLIGNDVPYAAVNAGGDLAVHGLPPGASSWEIGIDGTIPGQASLQRGALATSSIERRTWLRAGVPVHHLIDPRTGLPSHSGLLSVSAAAATCREAEVAAKVALLLGPAGGRDFLERHGISGRLVSSVGEVCHVGAWER